MTFQESVCEWLKAEKGICAADAVTVEKVSGDGTDWDGDTEGGFYSSFSVTIIYLDENGRQHMREVEGDDMASLWQWVVGKWNGV